MSEEEIVEWAKRFIKLKPCLCNRCFQEDSELLNLETLILFKQRLNELQTGEYELYILTLLQQAIQENRTANCQKPLTSQRTRKKVCYRIVPFGNICRSVFKELLAIGEKKLRNLFKYLEDQDVPIFRTHGNTGRSPQNKLPCEKTKQIETWVIDLAQRIGEPSHRNIDQDDKTILFLPACYTVTMLFELCINDLSQQSGFKFSRSTFYSTLTNDACSIFE
jgi:hypothetical protein